MTKPRKKHVRLCFICREAAEPRLLICKDCLAQAAAIWQLGSFPAACTKGCDWSVLQETDVCIILPTEFAAAREKIGNILIIFQNGGCMHCERGPKNERLDEEPLVNLLMVYEDT